jgi:hypothetical protein
VQCIRLNEAVLSLATTAATTEMYEVSVKSSIEVDDSTAPASEDEHARRVELRGVHGGGGVVRPGAGADRQTGGDVDSPGGGIHFTT